MESLNPLVCVEIYTLFYFLAWQSLSSIFSDIMFLCLLTFYYFPAAIEWKMIEKSLTNNWKIPISLYYLELSCIHENIHFQHKVYYNRHDVNEVTIRSMRLHFTKMYWHLLTQQFIWNMFINSLQQLCQVLLRSNPVPGNECDSKLLYVRTMYLPIFFWELLV